MTAEIAIMNTYGVALAADSAVTLTLGNNEKKIYNSANKIFTLSKYHPVGIMIYSNAQFMDIEWEVIIKEYRRHLKDTAFNTLFEYANDFFSFLEKLPYITDEQKDKSLLLILVNSINKVKKLFLQDIQNYMIEKNDITYQDALDVLESTIEKISDIQEKRSDNPLYCIDSSCISARKNIFDQAVGISFEKFELTDDIKNKLFAIAIKDIQKSNNVVPGYSGIVIAGYGEKELFPSLYSCTVYGIVENCLIRHTEDRNTITFKDKALIMPFAQSEMVNSFMEGIDPTFTKLIDQEMSVLFDKIRGIIKDQYVSKLPELQKTFKKNLQEFKQKIYIEPILDIVESLQKSDLAEMAESLVNLTSFKRHVSTEAETVGGPTDVAIITKGDGFIWIKRKHYFNPDLNKHFFENYFREGVKDE